MKNFFVQNQDEFEILRGLQKTLDERHETLVKVLCTGETIENIKYAQGALSMVNILKAEIKEGMKKIKELQSNLDN